MHIYDTYLFNNFLNDGLNILIYTDSTNENVVHETMSSGQFFYKSVQISANHVDEYTF